jgi:hypothetical protein
VKLIDGVKLNHPVQALLAAVQASLTTRSRPDQTNAYAA